ncbi:MAG: hypothetical protein E7588_05995 [Ruminococcaceae bacterium]|nr:hypothetical protein [Oscillospiraceae bacterium]
MINTLSDVRFKNENGKFIKMQSANSGYAYNDVLASIDENGVITVTSDKTPVRCICFIWKVDFKPHERFLGDAWERAYGDLEWLPIEKTGIMPWYFTAKSGDICRCFGVMTQPNAMCFWRVRDGEAALYLDVRSGPDPIAFSGRVLEAATVIIKRYTKPAIEAITDFCRELCPKPRLLPYPIYGGCDWYCTYGYSSYDTVISHSRKIAECAEGLENRPFMIVDAGWAICHNINKYLGGPWYPNTKFGDMKKLAEEMKSLGVRPALWYKSLDNSEVFKDNHYLRYNDATKTATDYTLDPSKPETLEQIKKEIQRFKSWGFEMIKEDFSSFDMLLKWGFEMGDELTEANWHFHNTSLTTAEIAKNLYKAIREAAGDDMIISGCNSFNHLCAGIYEFMRTGDDTSGIHWDRTKKMGVNTLAFRMSHHNTFYSAYADCVGITSNIEWHRNRQWLDVLSKSGTPTFVSISEDSYTPEVKKAVKEAFARASVNTVTSVPLDWEDEAFPRVWKSAYGTDTYCWD